MKTLHERFCEQLYEDIFILLVLLGAEDLE